MDLLYSQALRGWGAHGPWAKSLSKCPRCPHLQKGRVVVRQWPERPTEALGSQRELGSVDPWSILASGAAPPTPSCWPESEAGRTGASPLIHHQALSITVTPQGPAYPSALAQTPACRCLSLPLIHLRRCIPKGTFQHPVTYLVNIN